VSISKFRRAVTKIIEYSPHSPQIKPMSKEFLEDSPKIRSKSIISPTEEDETIEEQKMY